MESWSVGVLKRRSDYRPVEDPPWTGVLTRTGHPTISEVKFQFNGLHKKVLESLIKLNFWDFSWILTKLVLPFDQAAFF